MINLVVLSGAGISAESGLKTFRDAQGLWEGHSIEEVASPQGWKRHPERVLEFYNIRRRKLQSVEPNAAHRALADLESFFRIQIITQNVDDLHERAGSTSILHLHGELLKVRSTLNEQLILPWSGDLKLGDMAPDGAQLRPHIVWFGEPVHAMSQAIQLTKSADLLLIIGTSLLVYPAASLLDYALEIPVYYVDPAPKTKITSMPFQLFTITDTATSGVVKAIEMIRNTFR